MSETEKNPIPETEIPEEQAPETAPETVPEEQAAPAGQTQAEPETAQEEPESAEEAQPEETAPAEEPVNEYMVKYEHEHDVLLRLAAEYDNYRKRTAKEKAASYTNGKADTLAKLLPIYDNLERALNQPTEDAAYKKGVEMTLNELVKIFSGLGVEIFGAVGEAFDPNLHNAVMHIESEDFGENVLSQVFQKGFKIGEKVVRFAMVQVAN